MKKSKEIPFSFIVEYLASRNPAVKPMFGCQAIYIGEKIFLILRKKSPADPDNGVWVATERQHHASLKLQFPSLRNIAVFGTQDSAWQNLPADAADFEEKAIELCDLIKKNDSRLGRIPKPKKKKKP